MMALIALICIFIKNDIIYSVYILIFKNPYIKLSRIVIDTRYKIFKENSRNLNLERAIKKKYRDNIV